MAGRPVWILDEGVILGGAQLFALRLAATLPDQATIACPSGSPMDRAARRAGVRVADVPFPRPSLRAVPGLVAAAWRLRRAVPADPVVLSGAIRAALVAGIARLPNPVVTIMHEPYSAQRRSVRLAFRRSGAIVAVGPGLADKYRAALPGARIWPINNFLAPEGFDRLFHARADRASRSPGTAPVLGVVARLVPRKGVAELIEQLADLPEAWDRLLIAGAREDERHARAIEARVARLGLEQRISLLGWRENVAEVLTGLDLLIVPSLGGEGQTTVILEALAAGLPILARGSLAQTDFAGLPVQPYLTPADLARVLNEPPAAPADPEVLRERFGPAQALGGLELAVLSASGQVPVPPRVRR